MKDPNISPDLSLLRDDYEIVGELSVRDGGQTFIATRKDAASKRRGDQTGVVITVYTSPAGDEGNALSHLAADTKTLARSAHRRLIPVLDGRWLGPEHFAVVTDRITDPSLAQRLESGDTFSNPRTAAILREVNGLLEWAREQQIVHRGISADRIFLEPQTDRVRVSFFLGPKERIQRSTAEDSDARTIARLAVAMLTGNVDAGSAKAAPLAELRPDLPEQLIETTARVLDEKTTGTDVPAYLALVGMADPLAAGETEAERVRAEVLEEQRVEREKLANERAAFEQDMADQREQFSREREALLHALAAERDQLQRTIADERAETQRIIASERAEIQRIVASEREEMRRAVTDERAALMANREEMESAAADRLAVLDRAAAEDRARIATLRAELQRAGELEVEKKRQTALDEITDAESTIDDAALPTPLFVTPALVPLAELTFTDDSALTSSADLDFEPSELDMPPTPLAESGLLPASTPLVQTSPAPTPPEPVERASGRKKWIVVGVAAGVVAIIASSAIILGVRPWRATLPVAPVAAAPVAATPVVSAPTSLVPIPAAPSPATMDSTANVVFSAADSISLADRTRAAEATERRRLRSVARDAAARRESAVAADSLPQFREVTRPRADTSARRNSDSRADTTARSPL